MEGVDDQYLDDDFPRSESMLSRNGSGRHQSRCVSSGNASNYDIPNNGGSAGNRKPSLYGK